MASRKNRQELQTEKTDAILIRARNILFILLLAAVAASIILIIIVTSNPAMAEGRPMLQKLIINDSFGTGRGFIWDKTAEAWAQLPFAEKVFGYGPSCYRYMIENTWGQEIRDFFGGAVLVDSHNEFLYLLSTLGIVGTAGYFGLMLSCLVRCFRGVKGNSLLLFGVTAIGASLLQGLVNSPQVFSTPLLFVMLGILEAIFPMQPGQELESGELPKEKEKPVQTKMHRDKGKSKKGEKADKDSHRTATQPFLLFLNYDFNTKFTIFFSVFHKNYFTAAAWRGKMLADYKERIKTNVTQVIHICS